MTSHETLLKMMQEGKYDKVMDSLKENIREEVVAKQYSGRGKLPKTDKIIAKMIKSVDARTQQKLLKCHMYKDYQSFTDGHRIFMDKEMDYGYEKANEHERLNIDGIIGSIYNFSERVEIDRTELVTFIKTHKSEKGSNRNPYIIEFSTGERIAFDSKYLLDLIDFTGNDTIYLKKEKRSQDPVMGFSDTTHYEKMVLLLPVNVRQYENNRSNQYVE